MLRGADDLTVGVNEHEPPPATPEATPTDLKTREWEHPVRLRDHRHTHGDHPEERHNFAAAAICVSPGYADAGAGVPVVDSHVESRNWNSPDALERGFWAVGLPPDSHIITEHALLCWSGGKCAAIESSHPPQTVAGVGFPTDSAMTTAGTVVVTVGGGSGGMVVGGTVVVVVVVVKIVAAKAAVSYWMVSVVGAEVLSVLSVVPQAASANEQAMGTHVRLCIAGT